MNAIKDKLEKRGGLIEQMKAIKDKAVTENREITTDEMTQWEKLDRDQEALKRSAEMLRKQEELETEQRTRLEAETTEANPDPAERAVKVSKAFRNFLIRGEAGMAAKDKETLKDYEARGQTTTTTAGGYLVPEGFSNELEKALLPFVKVWDFARVIKTKTGNDIPWPTIDNTANKGYLIGEGSTNSNTTALVFGVTTLKAYKFSSDIVQVSVELMQDSFLPIEQLVAEMLAERVGRILNQYFTSGTGSSQPGGCQYTATDSGHNALTAGVDRGDLLYLMHSVNADYRKNGTWMFNDTILKSIKLIDIGTADARPLWQPSMRDGEPDTIEGRPYIINDEMSDLGSGNKIMLFGDFKKFLIRDVTEMILFRFNELYMANANVGFMVYKRADSRILDGGTHPIKYLHCGTT